MIQITIVGAGAYGSKIAQKYSQYSSATLRAVVSRHKPTLALLSSLIFLTSARAWRKQFGIPTTTDVFDICVHQPIVISILKEFARIGAKNFILPKSLVLTQEEYTSLEKLISRYQLQVVIASQWHYSDVLQQTRDFLKLHNGRISEVRITFSGSFVNARAHRYSVLTAFLPHMLQILLDLSIITKKSIPLVEHISRHKIKIQYTHHIPTTITSDLTVSKRVQQLEVFFHGKNTPAFVVHFAGGPIRYSSIRTTRGTHQIREDVLEKMLEKSIHHFQHTPSALTLSHYKPVMDQQIQISQSTHRPVAVIGGGIFGVLTAIEIAQKGHSVVLFEKETDILTGASLVNQCRVHMGYHYPRDKDTAYHSRAAKKLFEKTFAPAIRHIPNYYMVMRQGSLVAPEAYIDFCNNMSLPYELSWPHEVAISQEHIAISLKVPETIFDAHIIRDILQKRLSTLPNIILFKSSKVVGIKQHKEGYRLRYNTKGTVHTVLCAAVVNAAYAGANIINNYAGLSLQPYQYELCEMPVVQAPWGKTGWSIVDGPFFGAMPFGFSKEYLLYDVELSVLDRVIGVLPQFKHNLAHYNAPTKAKARFRNYQKKWQNIIPQVIECTYLYSLYTTRVILPKVEKTDARPTLLKELQPGLWQIFSGKITTSIPEAQEVAHKVHTFLRQKH